MASLMSKCVVAGMRVLRMKRTYLDLERLKKSIARGQRPGLSVPPVSLRRKYRVAVMDPAPLDGLVCHTIAPRAGGSGLHVIYLHGGSYVHEIQDIHWSFIARLIDALGCTVTVPIYPLAPAHPYRESFPRLLLLYLKLCAEVGPDAIVLMGDSAGGGLALALAQLVKERGLPQPRDIVLISPWIDLTVGHPEVAEREKYDAVIAAPGLIECGKMWAGGDDPTGYLLSPINGDVTDLGRITLFIGTHDIFLPDARRFRDKLAKSGVALNYLEYEGLFHVFVLLPLPESKIAMEQIKAALGRPAPG